ncbi:MAG TPA: putative lipopolysaccharide heptosyltransferase III, partial [Burkholderiales bacterium]|nr:putative lipopolysaccharide heptosyltransferase III [Burkholderiales bacterium]
TSPVFTVLKNHAPGIEIDALVYHATREMLTLHPAITNVYTIDRDWKKRGVLHQLAQELQLIRALRARRYDLLIQLTEHARGAWFARLLRPRYSVAHDYPRKRGRMWRRSFTHLYPLPDTPRHTVEQHLDALRRIGVQPTAAERKLVLVPGAEVEQSVRALLAPHSIDERGYIHIHPTSRWLFKCWEPEKYAALINLLQQAGERIVLTAAPATKEMAFVERLNAQLAKPVIDLAGKLDLKQLAAVIAGAKLFIGVDSVPMHMAAAMQTPTVVLFGPSSEQVWGPWQVSHRFVTTPYSCRPCGLDGCGGGKVSECLTTITVEQVHASARQLLR